ncbi:Protein sidekick -like protein, partial [Trichinella britovi]
MQNREKKKKETVINLSNYIEKALRVKFQGGREITGILKGYDQLLNLVLDNTTEYLPDFVDGNLVNGSELLLLGPQLLSFEKRSLFVHEGAGFQLSCPVIEADQRLQIQWFKNRRLISPVAGVPVLNLRNASKFDAGSYFCKATDQNGGILSESTQIFVSYFNPPPAPGKLIEVRAKVGGYAIFKPPSIDAAPLYHLQWRWMFNNVLIAPSLRAFISSRGALVLLDVEPNDFGQYSLEVYHDTLKSRPVKYDYWLEQDASGDLFESNIFAGTVSIVWKPHNQVFVKSQWSDEVIFDFDGEHNITWFYNGDDLTEPLQCLAENSHGSAIDGTYVQGRTNAPHIEQLSNVTASVGQDVTLSCDALGWPKPTVQWYFNGIEVNGTNTGSGLLLLPKVEIKDAGWYTCVASNQFGVTDGRLYLNVQEKPSMPLHVKAYVNNETLPAYVTLTWSQGFDGNSPIIKYVVEQRMVGSQGALSEWEVAVDNIVKEQHEIKIDNLKPSSVYDFRVIAVNRYGYGMPSVPSNRVSMPQQPPAAAPQNVAGSARSASDIMIQWQPPPADQWNGDILGYIVRYRLANYPDIPWNYHNISDSRTRNWLITDLITWREYEIQAAAFNERGMGVFSKSLYITTLEGVPTDAPLLTNVTVINSTAVFIKFNPPSQQMIPGVNLGYKVEAWLGEVGTKLAKSIKVLPYSLHAVEATMSGLEKYATYNITALCFTAPGDGPRSSPVQVTTDQDVPESVCDAKAEEIQFNFAEITWKPPKHPNGILLNYTLVYWSLNDTSLNETVQLSADILRYKVQGLKPVTAYEVQIYASTAIGDGPRSKLVFQTTVPPEMPGPPSRLAISNPRQRDVTLQFTPGYDGKTLISRWIVEAMVGSSSTWQEVYNVSDPHAKSLTVSGLRPFTNYTLRLLAENVVGRSPASVPSNRFTTLQAVPEFAPVDFDVQPISSTSVRATWNPLPKHAWNGPPLGYLLFYTRNDTATATGGAHCISNLPCVISIVVKNPKSSEYVLKKLCKHCTYVFRLAAFNMIGRSELSRSLVIKTYEDTPSGAPQAVKATPESPKSVVVTWQKIPENQQNGHILGYRVEYRSISSPTDIGHEVVNDESRLAVTLDGLRPYTDYRIKVAGITMVGIGVYSEPDLVIRTAEDALPQSPTRPELALSKVQRSDAISIEWQNTANNARMPVRFYELEIQHENGDSWMEWDEKVAAERATVDKLKPNAAYRFRVRSVNDHGKSPWSVVSDWMRTLEAPPTEPPREIEVFAFNASSVQVRWKAPERSTWNADVVGYRILYKSYGENNTFRVKEFPMHDAYKREWDFLLSNLKRFRHYVVQLQTFNQIGSSVASKPHFVYVAYSIPETAVTGLRAEPISSTEANVSWDPWPADASPINGFKVYYSRETSENGTASEQDVVEPEASFKVLSGLSKFSSYKIDVVPFNRAGEGPKMQVTLRTLPDRPGPVQSLRFHDVLLDSVNISWTPPSEPNGVIIGYRVTYKTYKLDKEFMSQRQEKVIGRQYLVVTNLEENVTVSFSVEAETVVGYGPKVNGTVTIGPQPGSPEPPTTPIIIPSDSSLLIEWQSGEENLQSAPVDSFIVQYRGQNGAMPIRRRRAELLATESLLTKRWQTLAIIDSSVNTYTVSYRQLKPGSTYTFRVVSRNKYGVSYPSAPSDPFTVPEGFSDRPFYLEWWFLVILALVLLVIVVIVVAVLWVTGNGKKCDHGRSGSDTSLQLSDGGIVTYQLRASKRNGSKVRKVPFGSGSHNNNSRYTRYPTLANDEITFTKGSDMLGLKKRETAEEKSAYYNWYASVNNLDESHTSAKPTYTSAALLVDEPNMDPDVDSIAQHYQTTDSCYRETWRRAKNAAVHRPLSASGEEDDAYVIREEQLLSLDRNASLNRVPPTAFGFVICCAMMTGEESLLFASYRALGVVCNSDVPAVIVVSEVDSGEVFSTVPFDEKTFRVSAVCHPATYLNKLVFGSEQGTLRLFNVKTSRVVYEFQGWHSAVVIMQQSPVIHVVAIGLANGRILVHNMKTDQTLLRFQHNDGPVSALAFRLDGQQALVSASVTGSLIVWNLDAARLAAVRKFAHHGPINTLIAIPDEPSMITVGNDNAIKTWIFDGGAFVTPRQMNVRQGHSKPPNYIRFHGSDGSELLSASADGTLKMFNTVTEQRNVNLGFASLVRRRVANRRGSDFNKLRLPPIVHFSSQAAREFEWDDVVCCHEKFSTVTTWSTRRGRLGSHKLQDKRLKKMPLASATCCVISPCGNTALVGYSTGDVNIYNIQSGAARGSLVDSSGKAAHSFPLQGICVDAFNQIIVTGCTGGHLKMWNFRTRQCLHDETLDSGICQLVLNSDNNLIGIALDNLSLHLYDIYNRRTVRRFDKCHGNRITDLGFGPGGQWLISSSLDCTIKVWDLASACLVDVLTFDDACRSFSISPNGQYMATAHCEQRGIYLWLNKTYYRPGIALRPLPLDYEPATVFQLPGAAACIDEEGTEVVEEQSTQQELTEQDGEQQQEKENSPTEDSEDLQNQHHTGYSGRCSRDSLCAFSGLSESRWANLPDLDMIRQRNKPKQQLLKAGKAPFFLKSIPGLVPSFDVEEEEQVQRSRLLKSPIAMSASNCEASTFADLLLAADDDAAYFTAFHHLQSCNVSSVYTELVNLGPESGAGSERLLRAFMRMAIAVLKTGRCFELINAQLSLFLQLHHQYLWTKGDEQLKRLLRELLDAQQARWTRLDNLFSEVVCMLDFVKASLI